MIHTRNPSAENKPTYSISPHEKLPAPHIGNVNHMVELLAANTVCDVLHICQGILNSRLLGANDEPVEVGTD